jgi:hypothetical protein
MKIYYFYLKDNNNFVTQMAKVFEEQLDVWKISNVGYTEITEDQYNILSKAFDGRWQEVNGSLNKVFDRTEYEKARLLSGVKQKELLNSTDWRIIKAIDNGVSLPSDWQLYRKNLRDIDTQPNYPFSIIWPTPPGAL